MDKRVRGCYTHLTFMLQSQSRNGKIITIHGLLSINISFHICAVNVVRIRWIQVCPVCMQMFQWASGQTFIQIIQRIFKFPAKACSDPVEEQPDQLDVTRVIL